ncbi:uncharacterized protein LOC118513320 [Anopheles stephensi]|uniref:uncharacterized protein LOC118513320 n=1 Tax=Anopheles stephensi TaxID=30069 RepID=UPI001658AC87|nr:uncharacterized protein LOC118513320 [Anopheles stephensi]
MEDSSLLRQVQRQIEKLGLIESMPVLMEESRKFLTHFINMFQRVQGSVIEDYYFQTLYLCQTAIVKCDVTERDKTVVSNILNTVLETIHREYVRNKVLIESLGTLNNIMCNLYHLEVVYAQPMLRKKLPFLSRFFCEMEHYGVMCSIVGILYQYVCKYDCEKRADVFAEIMENFNDPTNQLAEMLQWQPETFYAQCRKFLNDIPGRKYYSLAARSAIFGEKTIIPMKGMPYISFEWNSHPSEIAFQASFGKDKDNSLQANIDFSDIRSVEIIEDLEQPRVVCTYGKITVEGIAIEKYELRINVVDNSELSELAEFITPLINSVTFAGKNVTPLPEVMCDETVILHEKFYNTTDFASQTFLEDSNVAAAAQTASPKQDAPIMSATHPKHDSPAKPMVESENDHDKENWDKTNHLSDSSLTHFQPFDTKWKANLLQHTSKSKKPEPSLPPLARDPYDIELMRCEEVDQRKAKLRMETVSKRCANGKKNGRSEHVDRRPKYMQCSTPTKARRTTPSKGLVNEELSSIFGDSGEESMDDEKHDATYMPYSMLSKTGMRSRAGKRGTKRQAVPLGQAAPHGQKKLNLKMIPPPKTQILGTGQKATSARNRKTQICDISSSTPQIETAIHAVAVAKNNGTTCATTVPYSKPAEGQTREGIERGGVLANAPTAATRGIRKRLNSKHTTTTQTTTTKTTTTKTTAVGLATCAVADPAEDTTMQEDTITMPPSEILPCHATEQVHCRALYTVEKHQEYHRVHHTVNEAETSLPELPEEARRQVLACALRIVDIITHSCTTLRPTK